MAGQSQHDDDEQNQSQAAAGSVTPASAVAPGGERTDQCEYQYDNEDGSKHAGEQRGRVRQVPGARCLSRSRKCSDLARDVIVDSDTFIDTDAEYA